MKQKWAASLKKPWLWLLLAGCFLIFLVIFGRLHTHMEQQRLYAEYEKNQTQLALSQQSSPDQESLTSGAVSPSDSAFSKTDAAQEASPSATKDSSSVTVIGRIKIPSIHLDLPLVEGTDAGDLRVGAGHFTGSAMPGERGNCAIAGHRNYTFGSMFNRLGEVKLNDQITIERNRKTYQYQVSAISVVEPSDVSVLNQDKHKRELTLITCTPVRVATHRLIIRAELKEPDVASTAPKPSGDPDSSTAPKLSGDADPAVPPVLTTGAAISTAPKPSASPEPSGDPDSSVTSKPSGGSH